MQNIKEYLSYNPLTGEFTWIKPIGNIKSGSKAGCKKPDGYIQIKYKRKSYGAHRLAWYFTYGCMPECDIDHINEIPSDNRLENLRLDTDGNNSQNVSKLLTNNTSGYRGVCWNRFINKWVAQLWVNNKQLNLGSYDTPEEASEAYLAAKRAHHTFWREIK